MNRNSKAPGASKRVTMVTIPYSFFNRGGKEIMSTHKSHISLLRVVCMVHANMEESSSDKKRLVCMSSWHS